MLSPSTSLQYLHLSEQSTSASEPDAEALAAASHTAEALGCGALKAVKCDSCGSEEVVKGRSFAERGQKYCQECWNAWERCGWWWPSIRVATCPPPVGPDGLVRVHAEDAYFLPSFLCDAEDESVMAALQLELETEGKVMSDWHGARHLGLQFEKGLEPGEESLRAKLVQKMEKAFGVKASAVRLNIYRSNKDYKPLHYDRGSDAEGVPQLTVGASFGCTRELTLMHVKSGVTMSFPQRNGDVFAFTPELNEVFMHGVPRVMPNSPSACEPDDAPRMSLILWGRQGMGSSSSAFFAQNTSFRQRGIMSEVVKPHRRQEVDSCKLGPEELGTCCSTLRKFVGSVRAERSASATSFSLSDRLRAKAQEAQHAKRDESGDPSRVILAVLEGGGLNAAEPHTPRKVFQPVEPKVIEVYAHKPGDRPRKVTVERRRKWFEALDVENLLEERNCNFSPNWDRELGPPSSVAWMEQGGLGFWLQLDDFNNIEYDIRTPEQWLEFGLGQQPDGSFLPLQADVQFHLCRSDGDCTVEGLKDPRSPNSQDLQDGKGNKDFLVRWNSNPRARGDLEPVGRLRIVLQGEDPEVTGLALGPEKKVFADRIAYAFDALQKIDNMPVDDIQTLDEDQACCTGADLSLGLPLPHAGEDQLKPETFCNTLVREANLDFARTMLGPPRASPFHAWWEHHAVGHHARTRNKIILMSDPQVQKPPGYRYQARLRQSFFLEGPCLALHEGVAPLGGLRLQTLVRSHQITRSPPTAGWIFSGAGYATTRAPGRLTGYPGHDKKVSLANAKAAIEEADVKKGAELGEPRNPLVESHKIRFSCPYATKYFFEYGERLPLPGQLASDSSPSVKLLCEMAREHKVWIFGGSLPELEGDKVYNTTLVLNPEGGIVAKHRKVHLFDIDVAATATRAAIKFKESDVLSVGESMTLVDLPWCRVGVGICYDSRFPELALAMRAEGAKVLVYPGAFNMTTGPAHYQLLARGRAVDTQSYVVFCSPSRSPDKNDYQAWGHSQLINPWAEIVVEAEHEPGVWVVEVDPSEADRIREQARPTGSTTSRHCRAR
ncbi:Omega-amidase NIT2 (Nitrilase homolog 2) [Durusdinium trenchii]|uniref:Omega-amidase NIT2 (Nitrilase homolog 2) n=1 Tax=Durusdinium trenchii TaxID=1381693 RepID=A0ABP0MJR4_9DINO